MQSNKPIKLEIKYIEHSIAALIQDHVDNYEIENGIITGNDYYLDPVKGIVVIKLFVQKASDE